MPTRRTRGSAIVSTAWQIDAHSFALPFVAAPSDAVVSPDTAVEVERLGGLAVLDGEGRLGALRGPDGRTRPRWAPTCAQLQQVYAKPVSPELLRARIGELRSAGVRVAVRLSPQHTAELAPHALAEGVDLLVIQGTVISAEHVVREDIPGLNLKTFIADLDVPVLVGGVGNYQTALHLMRTGAAGVIIGYGAHLGSTTHAVLGIDVPMATALIDAAAARRDYLDETGGRYVHLVAYGDMSTGGDMAKALACGADAVMLGEPLAAAAEAPGAGRYWDATAAHPRVPRSGVVEFALPGVDERPGLEELLVGPTADPSRRAQPVRRRAPGDGQVRVLQPQGVPEGRTDRLRRSLMKLGYKASNEQFPPQELLGYGVLAEECGFDSVFVSDHLQPWRHDGGHAPFAMAYLARAGCAYRAGHDRHVGADADVPLPPGDRGAGVRDAGLPLSRAGRARARQRRVDERGAAGHRVARGQGAVRRCSGRRSR